MLDEAAAWLVAWLDGKRWQKARQILQALELNYTEENARWIRRVVNAVNAGRLVIFSAPGLPGFILVNEITVEEYQHWENAQTEAKREAEAKLIAGQQAFHSRSTLH